MPPKLVKRRRVPLDEFADAVARAIGPALGADGAWQHPACDRPILSLDYRRHCSGVVECAEVASQYFGTSLTRPRLVLLEDSPTRTLPDELDPTATRAESEQLFWRLVCTDQCEAVHMGVALALRIFSAELALTIDGKVVENIGLVSCERTEPFTRHIVARREDCEVSGGGSSGSTVVRFDEGKAPRPPKKRGGVAHRVLWFKSGGRQVLADFTGPQYGLEDRLEASGTPFYRVDVEDVERRFGLTPIPGCGGSFLGEALPLGIFDEKQQMCASLRVRDAVLEQLQAHEERTALVRSV